LNMQKAETSAIIRERVEQARERQRERFADRPGIFSNADMRPSDIQDFCELSTEAKQLLDVATRRMQLSARAYHRVLKLSRTIADLSGATVIETQHVAEAVQYRPKAQ
ncbi:MAG: magnesium chelatase, partial [Anaerolinea sp.]|nr:magnesium chelatase [Anaerolinea sp.]